MYCPGCRAEFREGFTFCQKCQMDLVESLPEPDIANHVEHKSAVAKILSLRVEDILKYGGIVYIIVGLLEEFSRDTFNTIRNAELRGATGLDLFALIMYIAFNLCKNILWGMFLLVLGILLDC